ncbi:MAG: DinB family protein [Thermomicrobiales bacterium]
MTVQIDFETVLATIDTSWQAFQKTFEGLSEEQLADPTAVGYWSAGDLAFHIAYWDEVAGADAQFRHDHNGNRPAARDWQALNDADYAKHKDQSVSEGLADMRSAHESMLALFDSLKADDFTWAIAELVDHYDEHAEDIRSWRVARGI